MSRSNIPPKSYGQSEIPPASTSSTSSTSRVNTPNGSSGANGTPSTSNLISVNTTSNNSSSPKKQTPESPRLRQKVEKESSSSKTRMPVSPRKRELDRKNQSALAESSTSESEKQYFWKSGDQTNSFEDRVEIAEEVGILESTSGEYSGPSRYISEPKLTVPKINDSDETLSSSTLSESIDSSPMPSETLSSSSSSESIDSGPMPSYIAMMVQTIWDAIDNRNWIRLDNLLSSARENNFRFDRPSMKTTWVVQNIIQMAPLALLGANEHVSGVNYESRWMLALDLLDLGCDWNARDRSGNRAIDLLRKQATPDLIQFVAEERPNLRHLFPKV